MTDTPKTKTAVIINGHPSNDSLNGAAAQAWADNATAAGYTVKQYHAYEFPQVWHIIAHRGSPEAFTQAADDIATASVICITAPMWNFSIPGQLKNFFDGALQARKHFRYKSIMGIGVPVGLVDSNMKVHVSWTTGGPLWAYWLGFAPNLLVQQIKAIFHNMMGIKSRNIKFYPLGNADRGTAESRQAWIENIRTTAL